VRRGRRWAIAAGAALVLLVAWGAWGYRSVQEARKDVDEGLALLEAFREEATLESLLAGGGHEALDEAAAAFARASDKVSNPGFGPLKVLPVLGTQLRSVDALTSAAEETTRAGARALSRVQDLTKGPTPDGDERAELLFQLAEVSEDAHEALQDVRLGPRYGLLSSLERARARFERELEEARNVTETVVEVTRRLGRLLSNERRYLLLAAHNGEMRNGAGAPVSFGVLAVEGGRFSLESINATRLLPPPDPVPELGDYGEVWGRFDPNRSWTTVNVSPRFPAVASLAARMVETATGDTVDGVVMVDPVGLASFLRATGPVEVEGRPIDGDSAVRFVLHDQYVGAEGELAELSERRLANLAGAAMARLGEPIELARLARAMVDAVEGRHVLVWSPEDVDGPLWEAAGVTGALEPRSLALGVLNQGGGDKLDQLLPVRAALDATPLDPDRSRVTLRVELANEATGREPSGVLRPAPGDDDPAAYTGTLALLLPQDADRVEVTEGRAAFQGTDRGAPVVGFDVRLAPGASTTVELTWEGAPTVRVEPSARIPRVEWTAPGQTWRDDHPVTVRFGAAG